MTSKKRRSRFALLALVCLTLGTVLMSAPTASAQIGFGGGFYNRGYGGFNRGFGGFNRGFGYGNGFYNRGYGGFGNGFYNRGFGYGNGFYNRGYGGFGGGLITPPIYGPAYYGGFY